MFVLVVLAALIATVAVYILVVKRIGATPISLFACKDRACATINKKRLNVDLFLCRRRERHHPWVVEKVSNLLIEKLMTIVQIGH